MNQRTAPDLGLCVNSEELSSCAQHSNGQASGKGEETLSGQFNNETKVADEIIWKSLKELHKKLNWVFGNEGPPSSESRSVNN
jgi:hypothetical protein